MLVQQIALVSDTAALPADELLEVSAAIQKQVTRDFGPIWDVDATVDPFLSLDKVPFGYWRVIVVDDTHRLEPGVHETDDNKPFALVAFREDWDTIASHEVLELLADPTLNRRVAGDSLHPQQGRVEYLVEVCDPCQAHEFGYPVNGRWMSDFYTREYFDPVASAGVRYSYFGSIKKPRQVLPGGYLSWCVPETKEWWMKTFFDDGEQIIRLPPGAVPPGGNLRSSIDRFVSSYEHGPKPNQRPSPRQKKSRKILNQARIAMQKDALNFRIYLAGKTNSKQPIR